MGTPKKVPLILGNPQILNLMPTARPKEKTKGEPRMSLSDFKEGLGVRVRFRAGRLRFKAKL